MVSYILYRIGQLLVFSLPLRWAYKLAVFICDVRYLVADKDRKYVRDNLLAIFPQKTKREIHKIRIQMFRNFAKYLVDFFRFEKIDREFINKYVRLENLHYLDQTLKKNMGVVVLTAHLGNWELGGVVIALLGYPFWVVALSHKDKRVDNFFISQRESKGLKVIPLGRAVRASISLLREGKILGLVGDRDFTEKGRVLEFFSRPTIFPEGPAALSLKTGAPIIPGFMLRNSDDTFTLKIEGPIEFNPSSNKEKDIEELMLRYKTIFEDYIRRYPEQWFMFRRFWRE
jgi:KDO2-lipid IV(A) lauroyltransferase